MFLQQKGDIKMSKIAIIDDDELFSGLLKNKIERTLSFLES